MVHSIPVQKHSQKMRKIKVNIKDNYIKGD